MEEKLLTIDNDDLDLGEMLDSIIPPTPSKPEAPRGFFAAIEQEKKQEKAKQQQPAAQEARTALLSKCLELVGRIIDKLDSIPSAPIEPVTSQEPEHSTPETPPKTIVDETTVKNGKALLTDIKSIFDQVNQPTIRTRDLIEKLRTMERWKDLPLNKYQAARELARLLGKLGFGPCQFSEHHKNQRGYKRRDVDRAFEALDR